jgi:hypothetical protein
MQTIRRLKVRDQVSEQIKQYVVERRPRADDSQARLPIWMAHPIPVRFSHR